MINIDGDYNEIIEWLDANPNYGIEYNGHGALITQEDEDAGAWFANVGLFSLDDDHDSEFCALCKYGAISAAAHCCDFSETEIDVETDNYVEPVVIEDSATSHLIRF